MTERRLELILALFRSLGSLDAKIAFEPSFKVTRNRLFENRFLLGIDRWKSGERDDLIAQICIQSGMPPNLLAAFLEILPDANHVYFGTEKNQQALVFKVYLEFRDKIKSALAGDCEAGRSHFLFTGYKWDTDSPARQTVTDYAWNPSMSVQAMHERLRMFIEPDSHPELLALTEEAIAQATEKIPAGDIQFLEVTEKGNPRRSFDINIYKAGLRLKALFPHLLAALRHYALPEEKIGSLLQKIGSERCGHLAAGVDRDGQTFLSVYYGVHHIHGSQLKSARVVPADRPG